MDYGFLIFFGVFALIAGRLIYGRIRYGSWTGSFLKGHIDRTVGEIELASGVVGRQTLKLHAMKDPDGEGGFVGVVIVSKAPMAASMQPFRLSKADAQELARYLTEAAR